MKIKDQVCSLELAKSLKELGVKQDSYFVWFSLKEYNHFTLSDSWQIDDDERFDTISAFTATELLGILPIINGNPVELLKGATLQDGITYWARYYNLGIIANPDANPADAIGNLVVHLIEQKIWSSDK